MRSKTWVGVAIGLSIACAATSASAQATQAASAEALFQEGKKLLESGRIADACPKFAESNRLDPGVGILLYLGDCYEKQGQVASAWAAFHDASARARARGQADREATAQKRAVALEPRLPKIDVEVPEASRVPGLEVLRDGAVIGAPTWGVPLPVDPGAHVVEARAPGRKAWSASVDVAEGASKTVTVPALEASLEAPPPPPDGGAKATPGAGAAPPPAIDAGKPAQPEGTSWDTPRVGAVVLGAASLAGIAVGTVFGLKTMSDWDEAQQHCKTGDPLRCDEAGLGRIDDANTAGTIATVGFAFAGAALGTALALWFVPARSGKEASSATVSVARGAAGRATLSLGARF